MPQQSPALPAASTSTDTSFVPRKEFIREQKAAPNLFAIIAIAGSNSVRLYSFSETVISTLRKLLDSLGALSVLREDVQLHFFEFLLDGKPWASPKSVATEKLLIDILATIYHCGYQFVSSLDYGRESDDRLAIAFSTPSISQSGSLPVQTLPASPTPLRSSEASFDSTRLRVQEPFALSFVSPTVMRVIAPPLHLTPAILQAVRASWPRGVVSEKKVGDHSFEFKLKGYKWFQQDTFATDSLQHILALLSSLDSQSFTLVSSVSLTNRSRVKDLWIFTGPATLSTDDLTLQGSLSPLPFNADIKRRGHTREGSGSQPMSPLSDSPSQHRKYATDAPLPHSHIALHARAATDGDAAQSSAYGHRVEPPRLGGSSPPNSSTPGVLRKPAPRAQVPVSALHEGVSAGETEVIRANLPSTISSGIENMTGVGANGFSPDVFYTASPFGNSQAPKMNVSELPASSSKSRSHTPPERSQSPLRPVSTRSKTPPLLTSNPALSSSPSPPRSPTTPESSEPHLSKSGLLGPGAFRDSAFSSSTDATHEIPIKWIGRESFLTHPIPKGTNDANSRPKQDKRVSSSGPMLPGGWQPSPIEEKTENVVRMTPESPASEHKGDGAKTPIHEVTSHVTSPEVMRPEIPLRKSEAAIVGLISENTPPPLPNVSKQQSGGDSIASGQGQGWVLVNVAGTSPGQTEADKTPSLPQSPRSMSSSPEQPTPSPQAKAIVVIDAVDNKSATPFKKRFFGLGRKNSKKVPMSETAVGSPPPISETPRASPGKTRSGLREKFRLIGTPEASRNDDKRVSID